MQRIGDIPGQTMNETDLWEELASLSEDDAQHVLTRLFVAYEEERNNNPDSEHCRIFFQKLSTAFEQTLECNLNRR